MGYMFIFHGNELVPFGYINLDFLFDKGFRSSTSSFVFTLGSVVVNQRSGNQSCITNSTMEVEYVITSKAIEKVVWLWKFLIGLRVILLVVLHMTLFYDNNEAMTQFEEPRNYWKSKQIEKKHHPKK